MRVYLAGVCSACIRIGVANGRPIITAFAVPIWGDTPASRSINSDDVARSAPLRQEIAVEADPEGYISLLVL